MVNDVRPLMAKQPTAGYTGGCARDCVCACLWVDEVGCVCVCGCEYAFREPTDLSVTEGVLTGARLEKLQCMSELI